MAKGVMLAVASLLLGAGAAHAQVAPPGGGLSARQLGDGDANVRADRLNTRGGLIRPDLTTPDGLRAYSRLMVVGRCMAGLGNKGVADALASPMNAAGERTQVLLLQQRLQSCQVQGLPNTLTLVRGVLSEGMYHKLADKKAAEFNAPLDATGINRWSELQTPLISTLLPADHGITLVVDCLVVRQPEVADRVLDSAHGSAAEEANIDALLKGSPQCVPGGQHPAISRPYMRAFVASSAYRVARWRADKAG